MKLLKLVNKYHTLYIYILLIFLGFILIGFCRHVDARLKALEPQERDYRPIPTVLKAY